MNYFMQLLVNQYYTFYRSSDGGSQSAANSRLFAIADAWQHAEVRNKSNRLMLELYAATLSA